jgi:hypothetical protein
MPIPANPDRGQCGYTEEGHPAMAGGDDLDEHRHDQQAEAEKQEVG